MDHTPAATSNRRWEEAADTERYEQVVREHLENIQDVTDDYMRRQTDLAQYLSTIRIRFQDPSDIDNPPANRSNLLVQILAKVAQGRKQLIPKEFPTFSMYFILLRSSYCLVPHVL